MLYYHIQIISIFWLVVSWWSVDTCVSRLAQTVITQLFFPKPPTTFLTCFCRGERRKYTGRKFASTGDQTHNHQVMSPTHSPLSHLGGATSFILDLSKILFRRELTLYLICQFWALPIQQQKKNMMSKI